VRIFAPKRDEIIGILRKLHNEKFNNWYSLPKMIRMIKSRWVRWVEHATCMREKRNAYRVLVGKQERKRPLERRRCRWEDNIKINLRETGWGGMDWIHLSQNRDVLGPCEHGNEPLDSIKCLEILERLAACQD
jgi:hypothetical protein